MKNLVENLEGSELDIVAAYDALVTRAIAIVYNAPYWKYVGNEFFARLRIEGDEATLFWPEVEEFYDSTTIERASVSFLAPLLKMPAVELTAWKADQTRKYDESEKHRLAREAEEQKALLELKDSREFERLSRKYAKPRP